MWSKLAFAFGAQDSAKATLAKQWKVFQELVYASNEEGLPPKAFESLDRIAHLLAVESTKEESMGPCLEYCILNKVFTVLSQWASAGHLSLTVATLRFFATLLTSVTSEEFFLQTEFHSALTGLLCALQARLLTGQPVPSDSLTKFMWRLIRFISSTQVGTDLFVNTPQCLPASILLHHYRTELNSVQYLVWDALVELCQVNSKVLEEYLLENSLPQLIVTKLCWFFQKLPVNLDEGLGIVKKTVEFTGFLDELYTCAVLPKFKQVLYKLFHDEFLGILITPDLQSEDLVVRVATTKQLCLIIDNLQSTKLLVGVTRYLLGRNEDGEQYKYPLMSPRMSKVKKFSFPDEPVHFFDVAKTWRIVIDNLEHTNEDLALETLKLVSALLKKGHWELVKLLIADQFRGELAEHSTSIDEFVSLIPSLAPRIGLFPYLAGAVSSASNLFPLSSLSKTPCFDSGSSAEPTFEMRAETGGTTEEEGVEEEHEKFYEGVLMECLHKKLHRFFQNSYELNLVLTGVIACLASYPISSPMSKTLHQLLFEPMLKESLGRTVVVLANKLDSMLTRDPAIGQALEFIYLQLSTTEGTEVVKNFMSEKGLNEQNKRVLEGGLVLQEFLKEFVSISIQKELSNQLLAHTFT